MKPKVVVAKSESVFEDAPSIAPEPVTPNDIVKPDSDLDAADKAEFASLLKKGLTLPMRAARLIKLTTFTDSKRAPVALRALQEINAITGVTANDPDSSSPMFVLPAGTEVAVVTRIPKK